MIDSKMFVLETYEEVEQLLFVEWCARERPPPQECVGRTPQVDLVSRFDSRYRNARAERGLGVPAESCGIWELEHT